MSLWQKYAKPIFSPQVDEQEIDAWLNRIKSKLPAPVFWLLGKTQSGKTALIRALTGDDRAKIGNGMQSCTRTAMIYDFPSSNECLLKFLDTRGLGEIDYDPEADLQLFQEQAQVLIVVMKAMDPAQHAVVAALKKIMKNRPDLPVIVVQTALHEGYPDLSYEHILPYPFQNEDSARAAPEALQRALAAQRQLFAGINASFVPVDFTLPEDQYQPEHYGLEALLQSLEAATPQGLAGLLLNMSDFRADLYNFYDRTALPHIAAYSVLSGVAGAVPVPFVDIPIVTLVQMKMLYTLAEIFHYPINKQQAKEIFGALGLTFLTNWGRRELVKLIPVYGAPTSALLTAASTYALGKTLMAYFHSQREGLILSKRHFQNIYAEQYLSGKVLLKDYVFNAKPKLSS